MYFQEAKEVMRDIDLPCWVAGGYLLSNFSHKPWRDMDIYLPSKQLKEKAANRLVDKGYSIIECWDDNIIKGGATILQYKDTNHLIELIHNGNTPGETIQRFDFTVCCCSLNNDYMLEYHREYFDHVDNRLLVYTGATPYTDIKRRLHRLKKYVTKGYGIDKDNLTKWLNCAIEQHDTILDGTCNYIADFETIKEPLNKRYRE